MNNISSSEIFCQPKMIGIEIKRRKFKFHKIPAQNYQSDSWRLEILNRKSFVCLVSWGMRGDHRPQKLPLPDLFNYIYLMLILLLVSWFLQTRITTLINSLTEIISGALLQDLNKQEYFVMVGWLVVFDQKVVHCHLLKTATLQCIFRGPKISTTFFWLRFP